MKNIYFYVDDSGILHRNARNEYFIYAGYCFLGKDHREDAHRKYRTLSDKIKRGLHLHTEAKACHLKPKHKNKLYKIMHGYDSFSVAVRISELRSYVLDDKNSIHRYKDYALKRIIKEEVKKLLSLGKIDDREEIHIHIFVDEQNTATNGIYGLGDSVKEELAKGIMNFNYGTFYKPILHGRLFVDVTYCDSSKDYLIQACDILANRIWTSYYVRNENLIILTNHTSLILP